MSALPSAPESRPSQPELHIAPKPHIDILDESAVPNETVVTLVLTLLLDQRNSKTIDAQTVIDRIKTYLPTEISEETLARIEEQSAAPKERLQVRAAGIAHTDPNTQFNLNQAMQRSPHVRYIESRMSDTLKNGRHVSQAFTALSRMIEFLAGAKIGEGTDEITRLTRELTDLLLRAET